MEPDKKEDKKKADKKPKREKLKKVFELPDKNKSKDKVQDSIS